MALCAWCPHHSPAVPRWVPPLRRLPPMLWLRLRRDLGALLAERSDGASTVVYTWKHNQVGAIAVWYWGR